MFRQKPIVRSLAVAFGGLASVLSSPGLAQVETKETVVITGTRLPSPNIISNSPITTISAEDVKADGRRNVEEILNNLPQVAADQGNATSNGATGTATVSLRNLGAPRTLVLVNGRRLPAGTPDGGAAAYAADLNQIPAALIQRVEIVTGGLSAVYGSDAVAGVVNFIMNDRFEGVQLDFNHGFYNHQQDSDLQSTLRDSNIEVPKDVTSDGQSTDFSITLGGNFAGNKGNAVVFLGYKKDKAVTQARRDFSACSVASDPDNPSDPFVCAGSGTSFPGLFLDAATGGDTIAHTVADAAGNPRDFLGSDLFNYGPYNYFQRPSERYSFAAFAHYDVAPSARVYTELNFHDDSTVAQVAPSGLFGLVVPVDFANPLITPGWRNLITTAAATEGTPWAAPGDTFDMLILRRNVEGEGRQDHLRHTSYRGVVGLKGEVLKNWNYDAFAHTGRVLYKDTFRNDFSRSRAGRAMDVVTDPATGQPACRSFVDGTDPLCVPYDIWRLGGVNSGALNYLQIPGLKTGFTSQTVIGGTLRADLGEYGVTIPTAQTGVSFLVGAERRTEKLSLETDVPFQTDDLFGQGGATLPLEGQYSVKELFTEVRVPIIEGKPFADTLGFNASYRRSDYSTDVETNTYGFGLEWAPVNVVRLRGSYQRAVRAANVVELFQAQGNNLFGLSADPCGGATPARSFADCARTGVTAAQYGNILSNPAGQYNFLQGGNPNLQPETAKSKTLGVVLTPLRNLSATIDYYDIEVKDVISNAPPGVILNLCLDTGDPQFCSAVQRDSLGSLWIQPVGRVVALNDNLASWKTSGYDFTVNYTQPIAAFGRIGVNFVGSYLDKFTVQDLPGQPEYECAGFYGFTCGNGRAPMPKWRHKLRTTWSAPMDVDVALTWRYIASVDADSTSSNPVLSAATANVDRELGSRSYFDIAASWAATNWLTVRLGVNNIFDKDPPITALTDPSNFGNGNTFPQTYDTLGRRVFAGLTAKF